MNHKITTLVFLLPTLALGCGAESTDESNPGAANPCTEAVAHLQACFPDQAMPGECHEASAQQILDSSCEELAAGDGKADGGWTCLWMPWLCVGGGNDDSRAVSVVVERCAGTYGPIDCYGTYGAPCTLVVLENEAGEELDRQYTGTYGSVRFVDVPAGANVVRVLDRAGQTTTQVIGEYTYSTAEAKVEVPADAEDPKVRVYLPGDSEATVKACSTVHGHLDVVDGAGLRVDTEEIEWGWLVRFLAEDGTVELMRPFRVHPDASGSGQWENNFTFFRTYEGEHVVEFIRMDIPSYARENNPDYEHLLDYYAEEFVPPESVSFVVEAGDIPDDVEFKHTIVEP